MEKTVIIQNQHLEARLTNYGATLTHLIFKDRDGVKRDGEMYFIGFDNLKEYAGDRNRYFGCTVGRVANRIAKGSFELNNQKYVLDINNGPNALHGGIHGFNSQYWNIESVDETQVTFCLISNDMDQGYPGTLNVQVQFSLSDSSLVLKYKAKVEDKATIINLTNHSYFNLSGGLDETILNHRLRMENVDHVLEFDSFSVPTGKLLTPTGSFDFAESCTIGSRIGSDGYDHCFVSNQKGLKTLAIVSCDRTGIQMAMSSTEPSFQFYTANYLSREINGKGKTTQPSDFWYGRQSAFCLEAQKYPNSINQPEWKSSVVLSPGEVYHQETIYSFQLVQ